MNTELYQKISKSIIYQNDKLKIDLSEIDFLSPFEIGELFCYSINQAKKIACKYDQVGLDGSINLISFLDRINFLSGINQFCNKDTSYNPFTGINKNLVELQLINALDEDEISILIDQMCEIIAGYGIEKNISNYLSIRVFGELYMNILEHSKSIDISGNFICGYYMHYKDNTLNISIFDFGQGFWGSLGYIYPNKTESEIIILATETGISSKKGAGNQNDGAIRGGVGLGVVLESVQSMGGALKIRSNKSLVINKDEKRSNNDALPIEIEGSHIYISIPL